MGKVFGKFYCHKCGEKLKNVPVMERTVHPGDPDWRRASKSGNTLSDQEIKEYKPAAKEAEEKRQKVTEIVAFSVIGALTVLTCVLYLLFGRG